MKVNIVKLANAVKYQTKTLTMNDTFNQRFGTDFFHWAIVRRARMVMGKQFVSFSDVLEWVERARV